MAVFRSPYPVATLVIAGCLGVPSPGVAQCGPTVGLGPGVPISELPPKNGPGGWGLRTGIGVAAGVTCRKTETLRLGGELRLQSFEQGLFIFVLGSLGSEWSLSSGEASPWVRLGILAGPTFLTRMGSHSAILVTGPNTKDPSLGFAVGPGVRLGVPGWGDDALYIEAAVLTTLVDTRFVTVADMEPGSAGVSAFLCVPITVGYQFRP